jgi:hypothetical protein
VGAVMAAILVILTPSKAISEYGYFNKGIAAYWRIQISESAWVIDSELDLELIESELNYHLFEEDKLFIGYLAPKWSTLNDADLDDWLSRPTRRWLKTASDSFFGRLFRR